jgi:hypothetical protein
VLYSNYTGLIISWSQESAGEGSVSFCKGTLVSRTEWRGEYLDLKEREEQEKEAGQVGPSGDAHDLYSGRCRVRVSAGEPTIMKSFVIILSLSR